MEETIGTLSLKIARIEHRLRVLKQQQVLSSAYPDHQAKLMIEVLTMQTQLNDMTRIREQVLQTC